MHQICGRVQRGRARREAVPLWKRLCACVSKDAASNRAATSYRRLCSTRSSSVCSSLIENAGGHHAGLHAPRLYLPNTVAFYGKFRALLDFESARFYDPLWDFVKLDAWVFRQHPRLLEPFLEGYRDVVHWRMDFNRRIFLYQALEYLAAFPYFGVASPNARMLHDFGHLSANGMPTAPSLARREGGELMKDLGSGDGREQRIGRHHVPARRERSTCADLFLTRRARQALRSRSSAQAASSR